METPQFSRSAALPGWLRSSSTVCHSSIFTHEFFSFFFVVNWEAPPSFNQHISEGEMLLICSPRKSHKFAIDFLMEAENIIEKLMDRYWLMGPFLLCFSRRQVREFCPPF